MNNHNNDRRQEGDSDILKRLFGEKAAEHVAKKTEKSKKSEEKTSIKNNGAKRLIEDLEKLQEGYPQKRLHSRCLRRWTTPLPFPKI